jgi:fructose-bisphosphate aldolase class II
MQATAAARDICRARFEAFGSAGQASKIKPLSLDRVAEGYRKMQPSRKIA